MSEEFLCGFKLLRELGARSLPAYAAIDPKPRRPEDALCVVDRLTRGEGVSAEGAAVFLRDGKRLAQQRHPNLVHVRDVVLGTGVMLLVSDWIDGELLADVQRLATARAIPIPLAGSLRIVTDLLEGLSALHELRDARQEPLSIVHAEVAPRNVVVGTDGRAVLVHPLRPPMGPTREHAPEVVGYLAPEVLLGDQTADQRADVYGAGVLLWEALAGARMHPENEGTGEIVMRLLGGRIPALSAPAGAPWAAPLVEVAKRAVSPDPSVRFANATAMLAEVRRVVAGHVAPTLTVAALVEAVCGDQVRARAVALGASRSVRLPSQSAWTTEAAAGTPKAPAASEEATPVVRVEARLALDLESPPLPSSSRPAPSSPRRVAAPSWGRVKTPSSRPSIPKAATVHADPSKSAPPAPFDAVDVDVEDLSPRRDAVPADAPRGLPQRQREPLDEEATAVDRSAAQALPQPDAPMRQSRTEDVAALIAAPPPPTVTTKKARWTILLACAIGAATVLWLLLRSTEPARSDPDDAPAPSIPATTAEPPATTAAPPPTGTAPPHSGAESAALDSPPSDRRTRANTAPPFSPPLPTVSAPAPSPAPSPPPPQSPATAPAASSTHPKKHVYDPMGI